MNGNKSLISFLVGMGSFTPIASSNFFFNAGWFDTYEIYMIPLIGFSIAFVNYGLLILELPNFHKTVLMGFSWVALTLGIPAISWEAGCNCIVPMQVAFGNLSLILSAFVAGLYLLVYIGNQIAYKKAKLRLQSPPG